MQSMLCKFVLLFQNDQATTHLGHIMFLNTLQFGSVDYVYLYNQMKIIVIAR